MRSRNSGPRRASSHLSESLSVSFVSGFLNMKMVHLVCCLYRWRFPSPSGRIVELICAKVSATSRSSRLKLESLLSSSEITDNTHIDSSHEVIELNF